MKIKRIYQTGIKIEIEILIYKNNKSKNICILFVKKNKYYGQRLFI